MDYSEKVLNYNREIKEALTTLFDELNIGQQKKVQKNQKVKALLIKYGVIAEEVTEP